MIELRRYGRPKNVFKNKKKEKSYTFNEVCKINQK